jgi:hypothetical protein
MVKLNDEIGPRVVPANAPVKAEDLPGRIPYGPLNAVEVGYVESELHRINPDTGNFERVVPADAPDEEPTEVITPEEQAEGVPGDPDSVGSGGGDPNLVTTDETVVNAEFERPGEEEAIEQNFEPQEETPEPVKPKPSRRRR